MSWRNLALVSILKTVSFGSKNYAFSVFWSSTRERTTKCKVNGITLNYEN